MKRLATLVATVAASLAATPAVALAQTEEIEPNLNWVFMMAVMIGVGFVAFIGFAVLYYLLAVVARNRRFATQAAAPAPARAAAPVAAAPALAAAPPQAAPAAAPAQAAAPAPAPAPAVEPATAPAAVPAPAAPAGAPAGGVPRIDPLQLPDGVDAVTRGRLKKLAVLQDRGQAPPKELIEQLKTVLEEMGGATIDVDTAATAPAASAPAAVATAAPAPELVAAEPAPAPAEAPAPAPAAPEPVAASEPTPAEPAAAAGDTHGLPRIDPMNLPDGIDAVARGRLKKLAIFQERGQAPPADLVVSLKPILDQMGS